MATERMGSPGWSTLLVLLLGGAGPWAASAQAPLFLVNGETTVASVEIDARGQAPFSRNRLLDHMALRGPPALAGLRSAFKWLPFVSEPRPVAFDPVTLQKDVVRLRRFYRSNGFPRAEVDYDVELDTLDNRVDVRLRIESGPARILDSVTVAVPEGDTVGLELEALAEVLDERRDQRLGEMEVNALRDRVLGWASRRGRAFPRAATRLETTPDSLSVVLRVELDPGPVATVDRIRVADSARLDRETVLQQLLFEPGDPFSSRRLDESTQQLLDLDLVQVALVELEPDQPRDSTAAVQVRLTEGSPRLVSGRVGYADHQGLLAEADWSHRDFMGGARTLRVSGVGETGVGAVGRMTSRLFGASVSLEQPYLADPRVSLITSLSGDYRDGSRETARTVGGDATAIWERGAQRFVSLRYGVYVRDVLDSRGGGGSGTFGVLEFLRRLEETEGSTRKTTVALSSSWGRRDNLTAPSRGWNVQGGLEFAGPDAWSDVQFLRGTLSGAVLRALTGGGVRILARARLGRLFPLGRSRPGDNPLRSYLRLGAAVFTEGGTGRVRGWEEGALGPKLPDLEIRQSGDSVVARPTGRYAPLGGLARWGASMEVQLPLPLLGGRHYGILFLDGGRVWTPEGGYLGEEGLPALASDNRARYGAGAGLAFSTLVGPVRIMLGYKLNPSPLDLRNPGAVGEALLAGRPVSDVSENPWRRWRLHLSIGQVF